MAVFIRGGQVTIHYLRMFKQVAIKLVRTSLAFILAYTAYSIYVSSITLYKFKILLYHYLSKFLVKVDLPNKVLSIENSYGQVNTYRAIDIINNPVVTEQVTNINLYLASTISTGFKYSIYLAAFILGIFTLKGLNMGKDKIIRGKNIISSTRLKYQITLVNLAQRFLSLEYYADLIDNILSKNLKTFLAQSKPTKISDIPFPHGTENTHTIITGASGTGKTVIISSIIEQIRKKKQKAIIYDKMGVFTSRFYDPSKGDIILNPLDKRSPNWSIVNEGKKLSDFDTISKAFIASKSSGDPYWENSARIVFAEILKYLKRNDDYDNESLKDLFFGSNTSIFEKIINSSGIIKKILPKESYRTVGSIISVMTAYVNSLQYLTNSEDGEIFSIRDWIEDDSRSGFLIIPSRANQHETLKPLISVFLEIAVNSLLSLKQNRNRRVWIFLDELPTLHYIPSLQFGLSESRQFGGSFVITLQLMAQLRDIYGKDLAESVSGLCRNRVIFATPDEETATWCSNSLGKVEIEETKEGISYGSHDMRDGVNINKQTTHRQLVLPTEIMNLENLNYYLRFGNGSPVCKNTAQYKHYPEIAQRYEETEDIIIPYLNQITPKPTTSNIEEPQQQDITKEPIQLEEIEIKEEWSEEDNDSDPSDYYKNF